MITTADSTDDISLCAQVRYCSSPVEVKVDLIFSKTLRFSI